MARLNEFDLEAVDFQEDSALAKGLIAEIKRLRRNVYTTEKELKKSNIAKIIKDTTGCTVKLVGIHELNAYVQTPDIDTKNPILDYRMQWQTGKVGRTKIKKTGSIRGSVDLKHSVVTGDLADFTSNVGIGLPLVSKDCPLTVEEAASVIMHEVGHIFIFLMFVSRYTRVSVIMQQATKACMEAEVPEIRSEILKSVGKELGSRVSEIEYLSERARKPEAYQLAIMDSEIRGCMDQYGYNAYSFRSWEQMADQFVARHGLARHMASGIVKINRFYGTDEVASRGTYILRLALRTAILVVISPLVPVVPLIVGLSILLNDPEMQVYDDLNERVAKMKHQIHVQLKNRDLSSDMRKALLADIDMIIEMEKGIKEQYGWLRMLSNHLSLKVRSQRKVTENLMKLEKMATNSLYAASARLSV